ncbi:hypothetical protein KUA19_05895 [Catellatospora sp. NEAU-YM18]|nr:hypothetical protein [Catellatospora tritici]
MPVGAVTAKAYQPEPLTTRVMSKATARSYRPGATEETTLPRRGAVEAVSVLCRHRVSGTWVSSTRRGRVPLWRPSHSQIRSGRRPSGSCTWNLR